MDQTSSQQQETLRPYFQYPVLVLGQTLRDAYHQLWPTTGVATDPTDMLAAAGNGVEVVQWCRRNWTMVLDTTPEALDANIALEALRVLNETLLLVSLADGDSQSQDRPFTQTEFMALFATDDVLHPVQSWLQTDWDSQVDAMDKRVKAVHADVQKTLVKTANLPR